MREDRHIIFFFAYQFRHISEARHFSPCPTLHTFQVAVKSPCPGWPFHSGFYIVKLVLALNIAEILLTGR